MYFKETEEILALLQDYPIPDVQDVPDVPELQFDDIEEDLKWVLSD